MTTNDIDARTIAADMMTAAARDVDRLDVWGHIGKAYDVLTIDENIDIQVLDLIGKASIDLIWPDGSRDTELDAARVEIERLTAQLSEQQRVIDAAKAWRDSDDLQLFGVDEIGEELVAAVDALPPGMSR